MTSINLSQIIAPVYYPVHKAIKNHEYTHYNLYGGRGSAKSSFTSIEVILLLISNPKMHAVVFRKIAATLRTSVYAQYLWAIAKLGLSSKFNAKVSPLEIVYKPTGQKILFFGADDAGKFKSLKLPFGYVGITHFEEKDQFAGREEIRCILQSTMRGGDKFYNFETYNPPVSASNWANLDSLIDMPDRLSHKSCYLDIPRDWLGEQFFAEADKLRDCNERAYRHEYLGEPTGTGGNVFENVEVRDITQDELKTFDHIYMGIDWGYYPDPFVWVKMHYDSHRRELYIIDELRLYKATNEATATALKNRGVTSEDIIVADSAEPKSIADYRAYGLACRPAEKGPGSVDYSIKWLQGLSKIVVNKSCEGAAKELLAYEYERAKNGEIVSGYPDKDNHAIDAIRYGLEPIWRRRGT